MLLSEEAEFETWLSGTPTVAFSLARSFDPAHMRIRKVFLGRISAPDQLRII
jgi:hypothetical protein